MVDYGPDSSDDGGLLDGGMDDGSDTSSAIPVLPAPGLITAWVCVGDGMGEPVDGSGDTKVLIVGWDGNGNPIVVDEDAGGTLRSLDPDESIRMLEW